jgi:hypothetical protein
MNTEIDELKLTAYALGELENGERAAVESHLAGDPAALAQVENVRAAARLLAGELAREPEVGLTAAQHVAIERRLRGAGDGGSQGGRVAPSGRNWGLWASVAASTLIVCTVMAAVLPRLLPVGSGYGQGAASRRARQDGSRGPIILAPPAGLLPGAEEAEPPGGGVTVIEVEKVPDTTPVPRPGSTHYQPTDAERTYLEQTAEEERTNGNPRESQADYDLNARRGKRVAWFGVVREVGKAQRGEGGRPDTYELLLEHRFFDGVTGPDVLALSFNGAGHFNARVWTRGSVFPIKPLMLVRVYGNVARGDVLPGADAFTQPAQPPTVEVEYARVFPWKAPTTRPGPP